MADDFLQLFHLIYVPFFKSYSVAYYDRASISNWCKNRYWFVIALSNLYLLALIDLTMCWIVYEKMVHKLDAQVVKNLSLLFLA